MSRLKELNQRVADLKASADKAMAEIKALEAKADRSDAEQASLDTAQQKLDALLSDAEQAVTERDQERAQLDRSRRMASLSSAIVGAGSGLRITSSEPDPAQSYGFRDIGEFAMAVLRVNTGGQMDDRLKAAASNFHQGDGTNDGYVLPPMFRDTIWELVSEVPDIATMVDSEPTAARSVEMLADESTPWGTGGIEVRWEKEGAALTPSKAQSVDPRTVILHRLFAFVNATEELLEDAPRLANRLTNKAALAIRWKIGNAFIYGDGVGKPMGWMKSPAKIAVAKEAGQAAKTIVVDNLVNMLTRLLVQPGDQPVWIANRDILPQLVKLTIGDNLVWLPPQGLQSTPEGTILGYPVRFMEYAQTLGTEGDLQLVSPKGYYSPLRQGGVKFDTSIHLHFDQGLQSFRWSFRLGGQPHLSKPVSPANGATTRSHFVTLATRA
jgi:HK97 family phage major capsid protein